MPTIEDTTTNRDYIIDPTETEEGVIKHWHEYKLHQAREWASNIAPFLGNEGVLDTSQNISREVYDTLSQRNLFDPFRAIDDILDQSFQDFEEYEAQNGSITESDPELQKHLAELNTKIKAAKPDYKQEQARFYGTEQKKNLRGVFNFQNLADKIKRNLPELQSVGGAGLVGGVMMLFPPVGAIGVAVATGGALTAAAINHYKKEKHNLRDVGTRLHSPSDLAHTMYYTQSVIEQLKSPVSFNDISVLRDFINNNDANLSFLTDVATGRNNSFYLAKLIKPRTEVLKHILEHKLVELVKDLEYEALGKKTRVVNGVTLTNTKPSSFDLLEIDYKLKQLLPLFKNKNHPTITRLKNIIDPQIAPDSLITSDLSGYTTKLDNVVTDGENRLKELEARVAAGKELTKEEVEYMQHLIGAGLHATDAVGKVNHSNWYGGYKDGVTPEALDRIYNLNQKVLDIKTRMSKFEIPDNPGKVNIVYAKITDIKTQINTVATSGSDITLTDYKLLKQDLDIYGQTKQIAYERIINDRRDYLGISNEVLAKGKESIDAIDSYVTLSAEQKNLLKGKKTNGDQINLDAPITDSVDLIELQGAVLTLANEKIQPENIWDLYPTIAEFLEENFVTAWLLRHYSEPQRDATLALLEEHKVKTNEDFDGEIAVLQAERDRGLAFSNSTDTSTIEDIQTGIQDYLDAPRRPPLTDAQKAKLQGFIDELQTHIFDLAISYYENRTNRTWGFSQLADVNNLRLAIESYVLTYSALSDVQKDRLTVLINTLKNSLETLTNQELTNIKEGLESINTNTLQLPGKNLNYDIDTADLDTVKTARDDLEIRLSDLQSTIDGLSGYSVAESTNILIAETQASLEEANKLIEQIEYGKTLAQNPNEIVTEAGNIYKQIQTTIESDQLFGGSPQFSNSNLKSLDTMAIQLASTIQPLKDDLTKIPDKIKHSILVCDKLINSIALVVDFKNNSKTHITDFLNWGWDNNFDNNYDLLRKRIDEPVKFLENLRLIKGTLTPNPRLLKLFTPYFEIMEKELEDKLSWYVKQALTKSTNYTQDQKIELNGLINSEHFTFDDLFGEEEVEIEVIEELVDDDRESDDI